MCQILSIESSADYGSAALFNNDQLEGYVISKEERSHSRLLASNIQSLVQEYGGFDHLNAVAISAGPGSYTGLRIGVSIAKGLCLSLDIPLISISTLELVASGSERQQDEWVIPVLHARKNEVYSAVYTKDLELYEEPKPLELQPDSFSEYKDHSSILFCGNGAPIAQEILELQNTRFQSDLYPTAELMGSIAFSKYTQNDFADIDTFEPEYLKPVYTTQPKTR